MSSATECPICMDAIEQGKNCVVTDCGHTFHCSCLMKNVAHNGFGCPFCRTAMAEEPEDDDDTEMSEEDEEPFDDDALTGFRIFHQLLEGEEVEPEQEEDEDGSDWETVNSDEDDEENQVPNTDYYVQKLVERGFTMRDVVMGYLDDTDLLVVSDFDEHRSRQLFGAFNAIQHQYRPANSSAEVPSNVQASPVQVLPAVQVSTPIIAEPKTYRMLCHV